MEAAVQNVERWVLAPLRNHRFFSLSEAREAIGPLLAALNERSFQKIEGSRRSLFEGRPSPSLRLATTRPGSLPSRTARRALFRAVPGQEFSAASPGLAHC